MPIRQNDHHLRMLGEILLQQGITGEILLTQQGVFMLDIRDGEVTKNISVYFGPGEALRNAAHLLAKNEGLSSDWLREAILSGFLGHTPLDEAIYPGLHIYVAPPGYVFTMSLLFGNESDDQLTRNLAAQLELSTPTEMSSLVRTYLPDQVVPSQAQGRIEQLCAA